MVAIAVAAGHEKRPSAWDSRFLWYKDTASGRRKQAVLNSNFRPSWDTLTQEMNFQCACKTVTRSDERFGVMMDDGGRSIYVWCAIDDARHMCAESPVP